GANSVERAITNDASLVAAQDSDNIAKTQSKTRFETASKRSSDPPLSTGHTVRSGKDRMKQENNLIDFVPPTPHDSRLSRGHTPGSDEGRPNLHELMNICTKLLNRVLSLEEAKTTQEKEFNLTNVSDTEVIVEEKGSGEKDDGSTADQVSTARPEVSDATPSTPPTTTTIFGDEDLTIY
nr:hypothetical protein [Tanacetum cinerariifolium]